MQRLMTVPEAANLLNRKPRWLNLKLEAGQGPRAIKLGKRYLIQPDDLKAWLNEQATA